MSRARGAPDPPEGLGKRASHLWWALVGRLAEPSRAQLERLEAYCSEKARWLECQEYLEEHGVTVLIRSDKGEVKAVQEAPQVKIAERARKAMLELAVHLEFRDGGPD